MRLSLKVFRLKLTEDVNVLCNNRIKSRDGGSRTRWRVSYVPDVIAKL